MKVMVIVKASKSSEAGQLPSEQDLTAMGKFNEELVKAGVLLAADGLHPSSRGKRVELGPQGKKRIIDGPFAETKELVAGFWIWQVKSMDEALAWAQRCPGPSSGSPDDACTLELRPLFEPEDFAPSDPSGELRQKEAALRRAVEAGRSA